MRPRPRTAFAAFALSATLLAACSNTNVGEAATVNGHRITESAVTGYVTSSAKPVSVTDQSGGSTSVAPRTFVVEILVYNQLLRDLLRSTNGGSPSSAKLASLERTALGGKTPKQLANSQGVTGYTNSLNRALVERLALAAALRERQSGGVDVNKAAQQLGIKVSLSPRYGKWDAQHLSIDTRPEAGVPSFITLQPSPAGSAAGLTNP